MMKEGDGKYAKKGRAFVFGEGEGETGQEV